MKKIYTLALIIFSLQASAQWSFILEGNIGPELRCAWPLDAHGGFITGGVAGTSSAIYKILDDGTSIFIQDAGFAGVVRAITCLDENTCIACGEFGNIIKTTDGGTTWVLKTSGTTGTLRTVTFTSATVGFIGGSLGVILKTTDGGETWAPIANSGITQDVINMRFADANVGYAASSTGTFSNGIVIKTTDGGDNWSVMYTDASRGLLGIAVVDANTVFAGGGNNQNLGFGSYIVRSTDGGSSWQQVYDGGANNIALRSGDFPSASKGWFVGDQGHIYSTSDGGDSWIKDSLKFNGLLSVEFFNEDTGWSVGATGIVLKYAGNCDTTSNVPTITFDNGILSSSASSGNQWYFNGSIIPGATGQTYTPTQNGLYYVVVTVNGCSSTSNTINVVGVVVNEISSSNAVLVFPNPMHESTQITIAHPAGEWLLITDLEGRIIQRMQVDFQQEITLSKENFSEGAYMIILLDDQNQIISRTKLMVQ